MLTLVRLGGRLPRAVLLRQDASEVIEQWRGYSDFALDALDRKAPAPEDPQQPGAI